MTDLFPNDLASIDFKRLFVRLRELFSLQDFDEPVLVHGGRMCVNVSVNCPRGRFFLKQYRHYLTHYVHEVKFAEAFFSEQGVPAILPIKDKYGRFAFWFDGHWYSLFPWVNGVLPRVPLLSHTTASLGAWLGRMHAAGAARADASMHPLHLWDARRFHAQYVELMDAYQRKDSKEARDLLAYELLEKKRAFVAANAFATSQVTLPFCDLLHGDFMHSNVFVDSHGDITHVYDFEKACRGPHAVELVRSLMINCFDDGWGAAQEAHARVFLNAYRAHGNIPVDAFVQAMRIYMTRLAHVGWLEGQVLLMGSKSNDTVLRAHLTRLEHADAHLEEWSRALLS